MTYIAEKANNKVKVSLASKNWTKEVNSAKTIMFGIPFLLQENYI